MLFERLKASKQQYKPGVKEKYRESIIWGLTKGGEDSLICDVVYVSLYHCIGCEIEVDFYTGKKGSVFFCLSICLLETVSASPSIVIVCWPS